MSAGTGSGQGGGQASGMSQAQMTQDMSGGLISAPAGGGPSGQAVAATKPERIEAPARYMVDHETRYVYAAPVSQSWQLARLRPRELPWQHLDTYSLDITPEPDERHETPDGFGNTVSHFGLHAAHRLLSVRMKCMVDVKPRPVLQKTDPQPWESVRDRVASDPMLDNLAPAQLCQPTPMVPLSEAARVYALGALRPQRDWLEAVTALMHAIHVDFEFRPGATTVSTSVDEVLYQRSGVCQDFAHLMLACLRGHGLPARYVSGYLLTEPPPGQARLMGADATHAWVAAYSPVHGWVEFDPTNDHRADERYITLAWGADFGDVVPLRGVILGGGDQELDVWVSVVPEGELGTGKGPRPGGGQGIQATPSR
ncbi:transglutaminase family protein [soil metagenome]